MVLVEQFKFVFCCVPFWLQEAGKYGFGMPPVGLLPLGGLGGVILHLVSFLAAITSGKCGELARASQSGLGARARTYGLSSR